MDITNDKNNRLRKLIQELPKTEIHLHLEGLASVDTIWSLIQENNLDINGVASKEDLVNRFNVSNLNEFIDLFINVIQNSFIKEKDIFFLIEDLKAYLIRENIQYAEIFFAPSKFIQSGFSFSKILNIFDDGLADIRKTTGRDAKIIIDVSRTFGLENAMNNLDLTLKNSSDNVIGIGLGGSEQKGPAPEYEPVFKKAAANGLHVVAHAGEDVGPESVWDAINLLRVERIGHGITSIYDDNLMQYLNEKQIPLEVCPKSNIFTGKVTRDLTKHPIKPFFDAGLNVTLNTDDPTLFGTSLVDEYMSLYQAEMFSPSDLIQILKNTTFAAFNSTPEKKKIWSDCLDIINNYSDILS